MRITVFTPTYNRAYIIEQLYKSLQNQSFYDFEWLVIDDGSTDNTKNLFEQWVQEHNNFEIRYYQFDNVGKQREINRALDLAEGELFFTVDSDDLLTADALEKIDKWEKALPHNNNYCGFAGSDGDMKGKPTNPLFDQPYIDATFFNRYPESGLFIGHDRPWVFYTSIHREFKYPEFEGEKFITESVVWNRMAAAGYKIRCYNDVIYLWEHQDDGLTNEIQKKIVSNPKGYGLWVAEKSKYLKLTFAQRMKAYYAFTIDMDQYSSSDIADFVEIPWIVIALCKSLHYLRKKKLGGRKTNI